jgi:hypothetical protein
MSRKREMIVDLYTKSMLTVIAGALVVLCVQNTTMSARAGAEGAVQKVTICVETVAGKYDCNYGANDRPLKLTH